MQTCVVNTGCMLIVECTRTTPLPPRFRIFTEWPPGSIIRKQCRGMNPLTIPEGCLRFFFPTPNQGSLSSEDVNDSGQDILVESFRHLVPPPKFATAAEL